MNSLRLFGITIYSSFIVQDFILGIQLPGINFILGLCCPKCGHTTKGLFCSDCGIEIPKLAQIPNQNHLIEGDSHATA